MYRFLLMLIAGFAFLPAQAQSVDVFRELLASPSASGGATVTVTEQDDAAQAVRAGAQSAARLRVRGFRVCIFFDNGPDSRAGAVAARALFTENYPAVNVYMVYDNPYFKVTVGDCLTAEEAVILKGRIAATFPKAFVKNEDFSIADLLN